jgi:exosortase A-associated hydrolase 2
MISVVLHQPAEPFFLKAESGDRFCIYYPPAAGKKCLGAFIYVHPFAEEMNKSRRMAALQSRALAESGYAVLQLDLYGCGDSSGDFADARWEIWLSDIAIAEKWILQKVTSPICLWGLRLGAVLALDYAKKTSGKISTVVLWQPVINTEQYLTQFLRLSLAGEMLADGKGVNAGTSHLKSALAAGKSVEIAGYELSPLLAKAFETINPAQLAVTGCRVHWFEFISESRQALTPAGENLANSWQKQGSELSVHFVPCVPFWATQEVSTCPGLIDEMVRIFSHEVP